VNRKELAAGTMNHHEFAGMLDREGTDGSIRPARGHDVGGRSRRRLRLRSSGASRFESYFA